MALNHFTFNGHSTGELGLLVSGINIYGSPSRIVEKINIPYRSGDLLIDTGAYSNYMLTYTVDIIDSTKTTAESLSQWLLGSTGYCRLTDTYNTDIYRMAAYYNQLDYTLSALYRYGRATITFDCKPQKYLLTGETAVTITSSSYTLNNPSAMVSKPLLRLTGTGTAVVNGTTIVVNSVDEYVDIDCDTMQIFKGTTNKSSTVTMTDFPQLKSGNNTITKSGLTNIIVTPRWWKL